MRFDDMVDKVLVVNYGGVGAGSANKDPRSIAAVRKLKVIVTRNKAATPKYDDVISVMIAILCIALNVECYMN